MRIPATIALPIRNRIIHWIFDSIFFSLKDGVTEILGTQRRVR